MEYNINVVAPLPIFFPSLPLPLPNAQKKN